MMDMKDLLIGMAKASADGEEKSSLTDKQTAELLQKIFSAKQENTKFKPGQVLIHKYPAHSTTKDPAKPVVFVEYIPAFRGFQMKNTGPDDIGGMRMAMKQDCIILKLSGNTVVEFLEDASEYMLHPDFAPKH